MPKDNNKDQSGLLFINHPSNADLRGRQSVRATFKLSQRSIHAISIVSIHLGIKQKSLFDLLFEDTQALCSVAENLQVRQDATSPRIQKTYVLSRKTLETLEKISKNSSAPRDALVEYSVNRLESVITAEKEKHRIRKELTDDLSDHLARGKKILKKAMALLGENDPVCQNISNAISTTDAAYQNIEEFIKKGSIIENY